MNNKAYATLEILIVLVAIVITSALILFLVQQGVLTVNSNTNQQILNTEFIPYERQGSLAIKDFSFCSYVNEQYQCLEPQTTFTLGDDAYFRFTIDTTPYYGDVMIIENYRILSSTGKVMLDVDLKKNFQYDAASQEKIESIFFKDYFSIGKGIPNGQYTLELKIENPLLNKQSTVKKTFIIE